MKAKYASVEDRNRKGRVVFEQVITQIRSDMDQVESLIKLLGQKMVGKSSMDEEIRNWVFDVLLDKIYETHTKTRSLTQSLGFDWAAMRHTFEENLSELKEYYESVAFSHDFHRDSGHLIAYFESYRRYVEKFLGNIRRSLHELGWMAAANLRPIDYTIERRKRFVSARDELAKAKRAIESGDWEETMNHLRTAIDLAIKEKFGFKRIIPMKRFLDEAKENGLPLPSYDSLYHYYDMGSSRIHSGMINPPFESIQAVTFVAKFIDALDLIEVDQRRIDAFKDISKTVQ